MNDFIEKMQGDIQSQIDREIMKTIEMSSDFSDKSKGNPISDLNDMICKMTTVIVCSENDKEKFEKQELPPMVKIIPDKHMEDGKVFLIKDENLKRMMLGMDARVELSEFPF